MKTAKSLRGWKASRKLPLHSPHPKGQACSSSHHWLTPSPRGCVPGWTQAARRSGTPGSCLLQGPSHASTASPRCANTRAGPHSSLLERRQRLLPWQPHIVLVYKPPSTLPHLTATNHHLAHGHLSIKKEGVLNAKKITFWNVCYCLHFC